MISHVLQAKEVPKEIDHRKAANPYESKHGPNWEEMTFMSDNIQAGSNIFLTSGQLDPWRAAGIQSVPKGTRDNSIIVRIIEGGAHHFDLRPSHPMDPPSVIAVRKEEMAAMEAWIREWREMYPADEESTRTGLNHLRGGRLQTSDL